MQQEQSYYQGTTKDLLLSLQVDPLRGLEDAEVLKRRNQFGKNKLTAEKKRNIIQMILDQFMNFLVLILVGAGLLAYALGEPRDAVILFVIVLINASIGFFQEWKSERILASLKSLIKETTRVVRQGKDSEIPVEQLVPGDIVLLEEGNGVPADLRLIETENFATNDVILTGESAPQSKNHTLIYDQPVALTNRDNCVFMGVTVARGFARGVVVKTGMQTEIGSIAQTSQHMEEEQSPLQKEINTLAGTITKVAMGIALLIFCVEYFISADGLKGALIFAIGIAASMVPEGMPAQISVALSLGIGRMAKNKAVVKRMSSIETLGAATVVASDKTGTITKNEMTIVTCFFDGELFTVTGTGYSPEGQIMDSQGNVLTHEHLQIKKVFFLDGYLASTGRVNPPDREHSGWYAIGDPTECAFSTLAMKAGMKLEEIDQQYQKRSVLFFDSERKRMSIVREHNQKKILFVKGAMESVLSISTKQVDQDIVKDLTDVDKRELLAMAKTYASQAYRVLALAYRDLPDQLSGYSIENTEQDVIFAGFVVMLDPPHEEVHEAIRHAFDAHLKVVMITGDNAATAKAIANRIGLTLENHSLPTVINGESLVNLSDQDIIELFQSRAIIFSRVSPDDKLRIVTLLRQQGEVVAVTGDGVNDALSLKKADIGVAMGARGAEVAKEAADMILLNDNFSTIVLAIREGRTIYKNLEKTITSSLTSNFGELFCVLLGFFGGIFGFPISIQAVQILAVDLVGEMLPLTFLTFDPPEQTIMTEFPRDKRKHIMRTKTLINIGAYGFLMGAVGFLSFVFVYHLHPESMQAPRQAWTAAYLGIVLCQFMNILSRRTEHSIFTRYIGSNKNLLWAFLLSLGFIIAITYVPFLHMYLYTAPLTFSEWLYPIIGSIIYLFVFEFHKYILHRQPKTL